MCLAYLCFPQSVQLLPQLQLNLLMHHAGIRPLIAVQSVRNTVCTIDTGKFILTLVQRCEVLVLALS